MLAFVAVVMVIMWSLINGSTKWKQYTHNQYKVNTKGTYNFFNSITLDKGRK